MKKIMKYRKMIVLMIIGSFSVSVFAGQTLQRDETIDLSAVTIQLPPNNSPEYWNVRTEAISELLPLLTKKRAEMKTTLQLLSDYMIKIDVASDFAGKNVSAPNDPDVYFELLHIGQGLEDLNIPKPKQRPSWNDIMDIAMRHVVFEGYMPTIVEEGEDLEHYIQICQQKERYGQKVRNDLRSALDRCAAMWVYLDSNGKLADFKVYYADLRLQQENQRAQQKAQYTQQHRQAVMQRQAEAQQQKFDDAEDRAEFESSKRERAYDDRQNRLQYQQTLLNARFVEGGGYH